jgi:hypothetical protein
MIERWADYLPSSTAGPDGLFASDDPEPPAMSRFRQGRIGQVISGRSFRKPRFALVPTLIELS